MSAEQPKDIPAWEDFAAFGDMGELEHVCDMFEEAAEEEAGIDNFAGELVRRLERMDIQSRRLLESERPGLYPKTWMAKLIVKLYVMIDEVIERPYLLKAELPGLLLDFHKVMIAAHEIYDPRSRARLVAKVACEAADGAIKNRQRVVSKKPRASKGIEAAIHWAFRSGESAVTKTAEWVWRKLEKYDEADALECGEFSVFVRDGELRSIYRSTGKPDGKPIKKTSFSRAYARAKKVLP